MQILWYIFPHNNLYYYVIYFDQRILIYLFLFYWFLLFSTSEDWSQVLVYGRQCCVNWIICIRMEFLIYLLIVTLWKHLKFNNTMNYACWLSVFITLFLRFKSVMCGTNSFMFCYVVFTLHIIISQNSYSFWWQQIIPWYYEWKCVYTFVFIYWWKQEVFLMWSGVLVHMGGPTLFWTVQKYLPRWVNHFTLYWNILVANEIFFNILIGCNSWIGVLLWHFHICVQRTLIWFVLSIIVCLTISPCSNCFIWFQCSIFIHI
jgi:hypothetical protein